MGVSIGVLTTEQRRSYQLARWKKEVENYSNRDQILSGFQDSERETIKKYFPPQGKVLAVGCGGGRDLLAFGDMGYHVEGLDFVPDLVATANRFLAEKGMPQTAICCSIEDYTFDTGPYAGIYLSPFVYSYIFPRSKRVEILLKMQEALTEQGSIYLFLIGRHLEERENRILKVARFAEKYVSRDSILEEGDSFGEDNRGLNFEHRFTRMEFETEVSQTSLKLASWEEKLFSRTAVLRKLSADDTKEG